MLDDKMTEIMNKGLKEAQRQQQAYKKLNKVNVGTKGHIDHGTNSSQEAFEKWWNENPNRKIISNSDKQFAFNIWQASAQYYKSEIAELKDTLDGYDEMMNADDKRIVELQASINNLREALDYRGTLLALMSNQFARNWCSGEHEHRERLVDIARRYKSTKVFGLTGFESFVSALEKSEDAISATPAESLQAHDDELIEKCAKIVTCNGVGERRIETIIASEIRELKGNKDV